MAILRVYNPLTESWDPIPYIKGDKGDRGYDVTTVEYEYYSSTSSSETIGGEWSTIMPGYSEGRYIWARTKTTNSHGEVYTGTPVLATLFNDVNSAELSRRTYETNRVNAETARDTAEGLRDSAEIARASAELLRVSAETSRGNSEVSRANAEAQRVSAESSRVSAEAQRVANEGQRLANEDARIAAQGRYPIVQNSTWWVWSKEEDDYVDTEVTAVGANGVGIASIELTSTVDLVDTYTITFDDGNTTSFDVTNGADGISPTITVTEITGGHEVEVVDAEGTQTFDVLDGEITEDALEERLIDKADVITSSSSGEIVTIADGAKNLPVVDLKVSLLPVQSGSGDPSPDNIRPISGWAGVEVTQTGKNLYSRDLAEYNVPVYAQDGTSAPYPDVAALWIKVKPNTTYSTKCTTTTSQHAYIRWVNCDANKGFISRAGNGTYGEISLPSSFTTPSNCHWVQIAINQYNTANISLNNWTMYVNEGSTLYEEPFVGSVIPISWQSTAGTVYGGSLDLTTGVLTVRNVVFDGGAVTWTKDSASYKYGTFYFQADDAAYYDANSVNAVSSMYKSVSSNGATESGNDYCWIRYLSANNRQFQVKCTENASMTADDFKTAMTGQQFMYQLRVPQTYQLAPTQIATLIGDNSFWSNSNGSIDLEYRCDTKLYIEQLTKPSEDDMVANANIASGRFFMVGNRLMLSTTAIAQGEQIVVGTNCSEVSLADALNQINA